MILKFEKIMALEQKKLIFFILVMTTILLLTQGASVKGFTRVCRAIPTKDNSFSHAVFIMYVNDSSDDQRIIDRRTGSLINEKWVVTAAHCLPQNFVLDRFFVAAGQSKMDDYLHDRYYEIPVNTSIDEDKYQLQERRVSDVHRYPYGDERDDIVLLELKEPFKLNKNVSIISLANEKFVNETYCSVAGYGKTEDNEDQVELHHTESILALPENKCSEPVTNYICISRDHGGGTCKGDSGRLLICNGKLQGISSFSIKLSNKSCGCRQSYYLNIQSYVDWIERITKSNEHIVHNYIFILIASLIISALVISIIRYSIFKSKLEKIDYKKRLSQLLNQWQCFSKSDYSPLKRVNEQSSEYRPIAQ